MLRTIRTGNLPARPASRKREDSLPVHHWTRKEFRTACVAHANTQRGETDGDATSTRGNGKRGRPRKGSDKDNKLTHFYLENADGVPVSEEQIKEMSRKARMLWRTLDSDGMAPPSFGQISMKAWEYYSSMMLADESFDFLLLCDDGEWKLREWSTRSYPSWYRNKYTKDIDDELGHGESFLLIDHLPLRSSGILLDTTRDPASASNNASAVEHPTENGNKDNSFTDLDNSTSANNSDNAEEYTMTSDLNDTACGSEVTGTQVVHPPNGATVWEVPLTCAQLRTILPTTRMWRPVHHRCHSLTIHCKSSNLSTDIESAYLSPQRCGSSTTSIDKSRYGIYI